MTVTNEGAAVRGRVSTCVRRRRGSDGVEAVRVGEHHLAHRFEGEGVDGGLPAVWACVVGGDGAAVDVGGGLADRGVRDGHAELDGAADGVGDGLGRLQGGSCGGRWGASQLAGPAYMLSSPLTSQDTRLRTLHSEEPPIGVATPTLFGLPGLRVIGVRGRGVGTRIVAMIADHDGVRGCSDCGGASTFSKAARSRARTRGSPGLPPSRPRWTGGGRGSAPSRKRAPRTPAQRAATGWSIRPSGRPAVSQMKKNPVDGYEFTAAADSGLLHTGSHADCPHKIEEPRKIEGNALARPVVTAVRSSGAVPAYDATPVPVADADSGG